MTTTSFAAYYPAFFLHHCNVDRLYEAYLRAHPDSQSEFSRSNAKEYATPLKPFVNRTTGNVFRHAGCFDAARLGYAYDLLPKQPRSRLREPPVRVRVGNFNQPPRHRRAVCSDLTRRFLRRTTRSSGALTSGWRSSRTRPT
jgi:hypothetical protein